MTSFADHWDQIFSSVDLHYRKVFDSNLEPVILIQKHMIDFVKQMIESRFKDSNQIEVISLTPLSLELLIDLQERVKLNLLRASRTANEVCLKLADISQEKFSQSPCKRGGQAEILSTSKKFGHSVRDIFENICSMNADILSSFKMHPKLQPIDKEEVHNIIFERIPLDPQPQIASREAFKQAYGLTPETSSTR
ncbi:MAG: hypothetical protein IPK55_14940 [Streptococcus sp.]|nr:hypothetical protein [Streptococcus sp.]